MITAFLCGAFYGALVCMAYKKRGRWLTVEGTVEETMPDWLSEWEAAGRPGSATAAWVGQQYPTIADAMAAGEKLIFVESEPRKSDDSASAGA